MLDDVRWNDVMFLAYQKEDSSVSARSKFTVGGGPVFQRSGSFVSVLRRDVVKKTHLQLEFKESGSILVRKLVEYKN